MDHERRRWPRFPFNFPVRVQKRTAAEFALVDGFASEVNWGGMAVAAPLAIEVGAEIMVEFTSLLPLGIGPITAVVRDFRSNIHGIEFVPKSAAEKSALGQLRDRLSRGVPFPNM